MGYSTDFKGTLKFVDEPTVKQIAALNKILGEDRRDHPDWPTNDEYFFHINLELTEEMDGIRWNGSEKTYCMDHVINLVIEVMQRTWPNFYLTGKLFAQGEEAGDVYWVVMGTRKAEIVQIDTEGMQKATCPNCEHTFVVRQDFENQTFEENE